MMQYFDPITHIQRITIVGLGGTGAQAARIVGRILYDMQARQRHIPDLLLIDPDRVESKNVGRQLFCEADIGKYKAEIVGKRLNFGLGLAARWIPDAVNAKRHFERYGSNLVISCVDNHHARRELHQVNGILIGAGNHESAGQVCIGNSTDREQIRKSLKEEKLRYLPKEGVLFPALLEPEPRPIPQPNLSCAELVEAGTQSLLVNDWMATVVGQYVFKFLHRQPIYSFLTYVDAESLIVRSLLICPDEIFNYLPRKSG